jgi:hypothetical protein
MEIDMVNGRDFVPVKVYPAACFVGIKTFDHEGGDVAEVDEEFAPDGTREG